MIKKVCAGFMAMALLLFALPASAADYQKTAVSYLTAKYSVSEERIQLHPWSLALEYTGETFWAARYVIYAEGTDVPPQKEIMPVERILPADTPSSVPGTSPENESGAIYGAIYIREKTGEVLDEQSMDKFYQAEWEIAQAEWERLSREAGKLDVSLYLKLKNLAADEKVTVLIHPAFVETPDLLAEFAALKAKYPEFTQNLTLLEALGGGFGTILPMPMPMPITGNDTVVDSAQPGRSSGQDSLHPGQSSGAGAAASPPFEGKVSREMPGDGYGDKYQDYLAQLDIIRQKGIAPSLELIRTQLTSMGVQFRETADFITAELNAGQISIVADLAAAERIFEYFLHDTATMDLPAAADIKFTGSAVPPARNDLEEASAAPLAQNDGAAATQTTSLLWLLLVLIPAAFWGIRRKLLQSCK